MTWLQMLATISISVTVSTIIAEHRILRTAKNLFDSIEGAYEVCNKIVDKLSKISSQKGSGVTREKERENGREQ